MLDGECFCALCIQMLLLWKIWVLSGLWYYHYCKGFPDLVFSKTLFSITSDWVDAKELISLQLGRTVKRELPVPVAEPQVERGESSVSQTLALFMDSS